MSRAAAGMRTWILLAAGGALGTLARFGLGALLNRAEFPWGTVAVNAVGSLAMGLAMGAFFAHGRAGDEWRLLFAVGFLGAFTTMSAFAYESMQMLADARWGPALLHFALNPILAIIAAAAGWAAGRAIA